MVMQSLEPKGNHANLEYVIQRQSVHPHPVSINLSPTIRVQVHHHETQAVIDHRSYLSDSTEYTII